MVFTCLTVLYIIEISNLSHHETSMKAVLFVDDGDSKKVFRFASI